MKIGRILQTTSLVLIVLLASCNAVAAEPTPMPTPTPDPAAETSVLVQGWIDAYHALDADKFMSYYAEDAVYLDVSMKDFGTYTFEMLDRNVRHTFDNEGFKVEIVSFFVSPDGKFAALEGIYFNLNKYGRQVGMPMVIILEFLDGRIIRETDYYDSSPVK